MGYVVQRRLGRGASGVVDLAVDDHGRPVALKRLVLHGSTREMDHARLRIRREAEALTRVDHPHVVRLVELVEEGDEVILVMPYLAGGTLADQVRAYGPLPPARVALLADTLLDALAAAHRHGIVHRDIKPANVLFDAAGDAYLADFGVATLRDVTSGLTATGSVIGTPDFMAPEQARGEPATPASDVFSLGATLLFAATGQPPFGTTDPRLVLQRAARGRLAPLPADMDRALRRRLLPLLRRNPERRPTAAAAAGGPAGTVVLPRAHGGRRAVAALAGLAGLAAVATVGAVLVNQGSPSTLADAEAPAPPTTVACVDLPYQPCGQAAAPGTDGQRCVEGRDDYDRDPTNGCEAMPDLLDGQVFERALSSANLVPRDDVDRFPTPVTDEGFDVFCRSSFEVELTAPPGTVMRLRVLDADGAVLGQGVSYDDTAAVVSVTDPDCFVLSDDSTTLTTEVSWVGEARSAKPYRLSRSGSF